MKAKKTDVSHKLKVARGQLDGILKMVDENRYCVDISNQLLATQALLKSANQEIMQAHIRSCVAEALQTDKPNPKLEEALSLLEKCLISIRLNELQEAFGLIGKICLHYDEHIFPMREKCAWGNGHHGSRI